MSMIKFGARILGFALTGLTGLSAADAADLYTGGGYKDPYVPLPTWTGFYVGLDVGGAWATDDVSPKKPDSGTFPRKNSISSDGVIGGVTFGYNWQRGNFVFGFETDVGGMDIGARKKDLLGGTEIDSIESGAYADFTGRLGYAFGPALLYAKGGFAVFEGDARTTTAIAGYTVGTSDTFYGWTVGAGAEYMISPTWSIKAEYMHFDFGSEDAKLTGGGTVYPYKNDVTVDTVKFGVNLHFPPKMESLK